MKLTTTADLAAQWGMTEDDLNRKRRRYGWPSVRMGRSDFRFTDEQIALIVMQQSQTGRKPGPVSTGQTKRSTRRAS